MYRTLSASGVGLAVLLGTTALAASQDNVEWQIASAYPAATAVIGGTPQQVADRVDTMTGGEMQLEVFEPGALVGVLETFDSVAAGAIDAGYTAGTFWSGKDVAFNMYSAVPFGPSTAEYLAWMRAGGGQELQDELYAEYGLKSLLCGVVTPEAAGWFNKEINSVEDLQGLTMRFAGLGAQVVTELGVSTQLVAPGDIFTALDRGTIDAAEFSTPALDLSLGLDEAAEYYYFPGWQQQAAFAQLVVNLEAWNALNDRQRTAIETACDQAIATTLAEGEAAAASALVELRERGVDIRQLPDDVLDALDEAWQKVAGNLAADNENFGKAWESYSAFREQYATWRELGYLR